MDRATDQIENTPRNRQVFEFFVQNNRSELFVFMILSLFLWVLFYFLDRFVLSEIPIADEIMVRLFGFVFLAGSFYFMLNHARTPLAWDLAITTAMCVLCLVWVFLLIKSQAEMSPLYPSCSVAFVGAISLFVTRYISLVLLGMAVVAGMIAYVMHEKFSLVHPNIVKEYFILAVPVLFFLVALAWQNMRRVDDIFDFHINTRDQRKRLIRDNDQLRERASTDALTGLPNRSLFEASHATLMAQKTPFGLLIMDIDYFKMINEGYGHGVGDGVIAKVASSIDALLPDTASVFCLGGEEFVILVDDSDRDGLSALANTLVSSIKNLCIPHNSRPDALGLVTISMGGCVCDPYEPRGLKAHLEAADHNLYDAKSNGRNTFVI